ncbi:shikimate dehydrogenase [Corynebacterium renale]|uniref:shikimate dehydrogenase (NADP(+)) n=1 Tax=Corynebacterium renale TaxID=1724 RepID=A0A2A9DRM8_9CORY|nr:shikimate dehydrogenase [Corynebacterium renale]PFG28632.1 shikimate dehydrogenase [Corynebacterium renale]SQI26132.1 shikimate 5-dehydrogenase [Corynebacterium renale]
MSFELEDGVTHYAAVLGSPIAHSLSPILHNAGYAAKGMSDWKYVRHESTAEQLANIVHTAPKEFRGFSVTMPAKFAALECADAATDRARAIGSANTLARMNDDSWRADNTDVEGIHGALDELLGDKECQRALVIGAGGTARPAIYAAAQRGAENIVVVNRSDRRRELESLVDGFNVTLDFVDFKADFEQLSSTADYIISTVPAHVVEPYAKALGHSPVLDVIYDPWPTALTTAAASNGYLTVAGHVMLANQSYSQFEQFTGEPAPREAMRSALYKHLGFEV